MQHCFFIGTSWSKGTISKHFRALATELANRGHRVILLVDGKRSDFENHGGNPAVYTWPSERPVRARDATFFLSLVHRFKPDCLVANFGSENVMTAVGWLMRVPVRIIWYHTLTDQSTMDWTPAPLRRAYLRIRKTMIYCLSTRLIANSKASAYDASAFAFRLVGPNKISVLPFGLLDPAESGSETRKSPHAEPVHFTCAGRFDPSKGQDVLVRAIAEVKTEFPDVSVRFLGSGPMLEVCRKLAWELDVGEKCHFLGEVSHHEVLRNMASAMATVVPSRSEAFGLVNIESMAVGTPVVASSVGGIPDILTDGIDGFLVPPGDSDALAQKLAAFLSNPSLSETMGIRARKNFLTNFELWSVVARTADLLEYLVSSSKLQRLESVREDYR